MEGYDPAAFPLFGVSVDLVGLTVREAALQALVVRRALPPHRGRWALPGGFVRSDEGLEEAARRELAEETGLGHLAGHVEQLASYGDPGRDPRMRVVTVAYLALAPDLPAPIAGGDAEKAAWRPVEALLAARPPLAFDHRQILADGVERARAKLEYSTLATAFCPPEFTVGELRAVYEAVWGAPLDPRNFHRKATGSEGFLAPADRMTTRGGGRPAQLYRAGPAALLSPPILRPPQAPIP